MCFLKFAMEDGTILTDDVHKLYVFQVHKGQDLSAEDYLENPYKFDKENKTVDKKDLKSMNTAKFSILSSDFIHLRTKLVSTEITNDKNINDILRIPKENPTKEQILDILSNYNREDNNARKRILFQADILDALWSILENYTLEDDIEAAHKISVHVFQAFVQTVHPLITNKKEFGYAMEYLDNYIETRVSSRTIFNKFINAFIDLIQNKENDELTKYALMSMKISFKLIIKAFNIKLTQSSVNIDRDKEKFSSLIQEIGKFQTKMIKLKEDKNNSYYSFCKNKSKGRPSLPPVIFNGFLVLMSIFFISVL